MMISDGIYVQYNYSTTPVYGSAVFWASTSLYNGCAYFCAEVVWVEQSWGDLIFLKQLVIQSQTKSNIVPNPELSVFGLVDLFWYIGI